ncbi:hypothetical protein G8E05_10735 [Clostridium botulinum]|uniref:hypothetical protein n=1 Tax=Clostridium botulinum TaxID=1491 RepID=UPI00016BA521|nr:hypothetical protein [Clostridium botulinum]AJD27530.1 putative glutamate synthase [NADPH] small chain [Clostridium botulinum CDC_297]EPS47085.1 hypothetical protein CFSAN002368_25697 [Clostridium botulinum A1 str. CFSAN002368]AJE12019.1 putative glutamate synthase [NADPH] small chain [Clostridium botulinum CDC_1436]EDT84556.1 glutamate synthase [NADPH] small chain [Clostridium botulinum Bf]MBY6881441.1 hypothetical protein [Clostridium botulinum]
MNKTIIKDLEKRLREEDEKITIGDAEETTILKMFDKEDMALENILISLYNMAKVNQYKMRNLEDNLSLLSERIYKTDEDFTEQEKEEIAGALGSLESEQLENIDKHKDYLLDGLYCDMEDFDEMYKKQKELMNKIKYPTPKMNKTFMELIKDRI